MATTQEINATRAKVGLPPLSQRGQAPVQSQTLEDKYPILKSAPQETPAEKAPSTSLKDRLASFGSGALDIGKTIVGETGKAAADVGSTLTAAAITPVQYGINQIGGRLTDRQDVVDMPIGEVYSKAREQVDSSMKSPIGSGEFDAKASDLTTSTGLKELGGQSIKTGTVVAPIGRAANIIKSIGEGAAVGGLYNFGDSLQKDETLGDTVLNTAQGAAVLGAGLGVLKGVGKGLEKLMTPAEELVKSKILDLYNKSIKPTIVGKGTAQQVSQYEDKVMSGIKSIVDNKPNLKFTDEYGDIILGESPKSLSQAAEAIEQTKKTIFNKYDAMAKQAGDSGATVTTQPVIDELSTIINNKSVALANPKAISYAKELGDRLAQKDAKGNIIGYETLTPSETQDVIQHLNKSLEAFYKNPSYDSATQAGIDALFANKLREGLDNSVSKLSGEYQGLKNEYGALSSIEKDVVKASLRDARKNIKGLIDFTDVLSGGELVNGILTMSPTTMAKAGVMKGISEYIKYLNNPNRIISKVFQNAEKLPKQGIKAVDEVSQNVLNQSPKNNLLSKNPSPTNTSIDNINNIPNTIPQKIEGATKVSGKLISDESYQKTLTEFKKNLGNMNSGIDPVQAARALKLATYHVQEGAITLAEFTDKMARDGIKLAKDEIEKLFATARLGKMSDNEYLTFQKYLDTPNEQTKIAAQTLAQEMGFADKTILNGVKFRDLIQNGMTEKSANMDKIVPALKGKLQPLAEEARKYKSAEEFVKAQSGNQGVYSKEYEKAILNNRKNLKPFDFTKADVTTGKKAETKGDMVKVYRISTNDKLLPGDNVSIINLKDLKEEVIKNGGGLNLVASKMGINPLMSEKIKTNLIETWIPKKDLSQTKSGTQLYTPDGITSLQEFWNKINKK